MQDDVHSCKVIKTGNIALLSEIYLTKGVKIMFTQSNVMKYKEIQSTNDANRNICNY